MKKTILFLLLGLCCVTAFAQKDVSYAPGREKLAEETFQKLVNIVTGSNMLNLASDYADCMKAIEAQPELRTAVLENILFDYCNVPDELKTEENRVAFEICAKSYYTLRERPEWNTIGAEYVEARKVIEKQIETNK